MAHKRFLLFGTSRYDSSGGMGDLIEDFDTVIDCLIKVKTEINSGDCYDDYSIYDRIEGVDIDIKSEILNMREAHRKSEIEQRTKSKPMQVIFNGDLNNGAVIMLLDGLSFENPVSVSYEGREIGMAYCEKRDDGLYGHYQLASSGIPLPTLFPETFEFETIGRVDNCNGVKIYHSWRLTKIVLGNFPNGSGGVKPDWS
jgi:hypothetical protein